MPKKCNFENKLAEKPNEERRNYHYTIDEEYYGNAKRMILSFRQGTDCLIISSDYDLDQTMGLLKCIINGDIPEME